MKGKSTSLELDVWKTIATWCPARAWCNLPKNMRMTMLTADSEQTGENSGRIRFFPDGASTGGHISVLHGQATSGASMSTG